MPTKSFQDREEDRYLSWNLPGMTWEVKNYVAKILNNAFHYFEEFRYLVRWKFLATDHGIGIFSENGIKIKVASSFGRRILILIQELLPEIYDKCHLLPGMQGPMLRACIPAIQVFVTKLILKTREKQLLSDSLASDGKIIQNTVPNILASIGVMAEQMGRQHLTGKGKVSEPPRGPTPFGVPASGSVPLQKVSRSAPYIAPSFVSPIPMGQSPLQARGVPPAPIRTASPPRIISVSSSNDASAIIGLSIGLGVIVVALVCCALFLFARYLYRQRRYVGPPAAISQGAFVVVPPVMPVSAYSPTAPAVSGGDAVVTGMSSLVDALPFPPELHFAELCPQAVEAAAANPPLVPQSPRYMRRQVPSLYLQPLSACGEFQRSISPQCVEPILPAPACFSGGALPNERLYTPPTCKNRDALRRRFSDFSEELHTPISYYSNENELRRSHSLRRSYSDFSQELGLERIQVADEHLMP